MSSPILVVGAGAAGLMAGRVLARAGRRVTILEARDRCGGRIWPLPAEQFGYPAEGGAEFVHGEAAVTHGLLREAGLSLAPTGGRRLTLRNGSFLPRPQGFPHEDALIAALEAVTEDVPIADFLARRFQGAEHAELRQAVTRMVEGYDAADPHKASTLALRDEMREDGPGQQGRLAQGYGALIEFLVGQCRAHGAAIHLRSVVTEIAAAEGGLTAHCEDGMRHHGGAVLLALPVPLLRTLRLPPALAAKQTALADLGYGNVVKILLRFRERFWQDAAPDLFFLFSEAAIPTWWTQYPTPHPVLTGWLAGPRSANLDLDEPALLARALDTLAETFARPRGALEAELRAARAIDWSADPFAQGAYSYVTPRTHQAQAQLKQADGARIYFAGEALYGAGEVGTVEAALASGQEAAEALLAGE